MKDTIRAFYKFMKSLLLTLFVEILHIFIYFAGVNPISSPHLKSNKKELVTLKWQKWTSSSKTLLV